MYIVGFDAKSTMWNPIALLPDQTVADAKKMMIKYSISRVAIAKRGKPCGIVTEKDIARSLYRMEPNRRLDEIRLSEIMNDDLVTVLENTDLRKCAKLMLRKGISSLLVIDAKNNLKGIFTKTDLTTAYVEHFAMEHKVSEYMTRKVIVLAPDEPIHTALLLMSQNQISRLVVVERGRPIGIVTSKDLLTFGGFLSRAKDFPTKSKRKEYLHFIPSGAKEFMLVSDVMTPNPINTTSDSDLADAAYIMLRNRISGMPVVDSGGKLIGIITKSDVVKALAAHS